MTNYRDKLEDILGSYILSTEGDIDNIDFDNIDIFDDVKTDNNITTYKGVIRGGNITPRILLDIRKKDDEILILEDINFDDTSYNGYYQQMMFKEEHPNLVSAWLLQELGVIEDAVIVHDIESERGILGIYGVGLEFKDPNEEELTITCPMCEGRQMHSKYMERDGALDYTYIFTCPVCPAIILEYWDDPDIENFNEYLHYEPKAN